MIYAFSGNGNSERVAARIRKELGGDSVSLGFVFPVYGWRTPRIMRRFVSEELPSLVGGREFGYVWAVLVCGDSAGAADEDFDRRLRAAVSFGLDAAFSARMPDTYLALPGFRLDTPDEARAKAEAFERRVPQIAAKILARERVRELDRGAFARLKTAFAGAIFDRFLSGVRKFSADAGKCLRCGKCAENCPCGAISRGADGMPEWGEGCTFCMRCLHNCDGDAIEYGRFTRGKGRLHSGTRGGIMSLA